MVYLAAGTCAVNSSRLFASEPGSSSCDSITEPYTDHMGADWNASGAYTDLKPTKTWPPFVLRNRLFYANMESPVSCMETQIIAGKNAALLVSEALPL